MHFSRIRYDTHFSEQQGEKHKCLTVINLEHCLPADGQIVYDFVESQLALFAEKSAFIQ